VQALVRRGERAGGGRSVAFSGGADLAQTRAILHRGFAGDWVLTPRHVAREATPEPLPELPHPAAGGEHHGFEPPPI